MRSGETILGLDLGPTSVGWALLRYRPPELDRSTGEIVREGEGDILGLGVRIFPETLDGKKLEPLNKQRRQARLMRRQTRRRRDRRKALSKLLAEAGLLPAYGSEEWTALMRGTNPYELRAAALDGDRPLAPTELGRALYHLEKRRGFRERSHAERPENAAKDDEEGVVRAGIAALKETMGARTLGQHLAGQVAQPGDKAPAPKPVRGAEHWIGRSMVEDEFDRIVEAQRDHHAVLRDAAFVATLRDLTFFQRPTFWRESTLGRCSLEAAEPLALKSDWNAQQSVVLQTVNALRLWGGNQRPLTEEERDAILALCARKRKVTFGAIRKALKPLWKRTGEPASVRFTHERDGRKDIPGNATEAALREALGEAFDALPDRLRLDLPEMLWRIDFDAKGARPNRRFEIRTPSARSAGRAALAATLQSDYGLTADQATAVSQLRLPSGWSAHSGKALEALRPHLEAGLSYREARDRAYPEAGAREGAGLDALPSSPRHLPDTRNPAVIRALNELRKVVNNLIRAHGKPDRIRLELNRDLKLPPAKRLEVIRTIQRNETARQKAARELEKKGVEPNRRNIEKWLLWQESDEYCPYTGDKIGFAELFDETKVDIEHIVPRSRSNDNRMANKTICRMAANRVKGNRTPFEAFRDPNMTAVCGAWEAFTLRVHGLKTMPLTKKKRLTVEREGPMRTADGHVMDDPDLGALTAEGSERALRDSSFIARAARDFLLKLYPRELGRADPVEPVSSRVTVELRRQWGLQNLVGDGASEGAKARDDHRHHAVDALVVALADVRFTQRLSRWFAQDRLGLRPAFAKPWPSLRTDVEAALARILVSHRVRRKLSGRLHEETVLGDTGRRDGDALVLVKRKPVAELKPGEIGRIRDGGVRGGVQAAVAAHGSIKAAAEHGVFLPHGAEKRPIKRVRLCLKLKPNAVMPLNRDIKAWAELGPGTLHHIAFYRRPDGSVAHDTVLRRTAARRRGRNEPAVSPRNADGHPLLFSLCPGDMLEQTRPDGGRDYWTVRKVNQEGRVFYKPHTMAGEPKPEVSFGPGRFADGSIRKVSVDPIGRVKPARD